ncbi:MAG TPA: hypothetical protein VEO95_11005 [Chthoniobacteraceae bacterium]|nr:hypothetical protein [Chthoniobacteraceae bacterium]
MEIAFSKPEIAFSKLEKSAAHRKSTFPNWRRWPPTGKEDFQIRRPIFQTGKCRRNTGRLDDGAAAQFDGWLFF